MNGLSPFRETRHSCEGLGYGLDIGPKVVLREGHQQKDNMKQIHLTLLAICATGLINVENVHADFALDGSSTTGWNVDRYSPNLFTSTTIGSQSALDINISSDQDANNRPSSYSSGFYNDQGFDRSVNGTSGGWSYSASLYVTAAMLAGTYQPSSSEMWAGTTDGAGNQSGFYCFAFLSGVNMRDVSASPSAESQLGVFNENTGGWTYYSTANMSAGWNQLAVSYIGAGMVTFSVNGVVIATQDSSITSSDPSLDNLGTAYLEDYNFYGNGKVASTGNYDTYWTAITAKTGMAPVPEANTMIAGMLLFLPFGATAMRILRKKRMA